MVSVTLPAGFSYVLASATSTIWLTFWQVLMVEKFRKKAAIQYPQLYAEKSEAAQSMAAQKFNCMQRAHHNTLESVPQILFMTLFAGMFYPRAAAALTAGWTVARFGYTLAYSTGVPQRRKWFYIATFWAFVGLLGTSSYSVYNLVRAEL